MLGGESYSGKLKGSVPFPAILRMQNAECIGINNLKDYSHQILCSKYTLYFWLDPLKSTLNLALGN